MSRTEQSPRPSNVKSYRREWIIAGIVLAILLLSFILIRDLRHEPTPTYLSDMQPSSAKQDWGYLGLDRTVDGNPLWIGNEKFAKGLGTHANSKVCFDLGGQYSEFATELGTDFETAGRMSRVQFSVTGDEKPLYQSPVISGVRPAIAVRLNIGGVNRLCLSVGDGGDGITNDHADWGNARVYR